MSTEIINFQEAVKESRRRSDADSLAHLFSAVDLPNRAYLANAVDRLDGRMRETLTRTQRSPFDAMCVYHAFAVHARYNQHHTLAFQHQHTLAQEFIRFFQPHGSSFDLKCLYTISRDLRTLARRADEECTQTHRKPYALDECARFLNKAFTACIQHKSAGRESKRWGVYYVIGLVFKTYFEINALSLCKNILRAVAAMKDLMPLHTYPKAHQVTFKYYTGVLAFLDDKFDKGNEDLTYALERTPVKYHRNQELILTHLIPLRLMQGDLPSPHLLGTFPALHTLYHPFVNALQTGNVKQFDEALVHGERRLVESGTYGVVERVREVCLRGLFKKVWLLNKKAKIIDIALFRIALSVSGVYIETAEVECLLAGMIFKGYMKGYIAHQQQKVVLSDFLANKPHPFPPVKSVRRAMVELPLYSAAGQAFAEMSSSSSAGNGNNCSNYDNDAAIGYGEFSAISTPPSSPPSFLQTNSSPRSTAKRDILAGYHEILQATQSVIDASHYDALDDDELEWVKMEHAHVAHKAQLYSQRLQTESSVMSALQALSSSLGSGGLNTAQHTAQLTQSSQKVDNLEKVLSRHHSRLLHLQSQLLHHQAGVLARFIQSKQLLQKQNTSPIPHSSHFHANNDRASRFESVGENQGEDVESESDMHPHTQISHLQAQLAEERHANAALRQQLERSHATVIEKTDHTHTLQSRLQSSLDEFSAVVSTRDTLTGGVGALGGVLDAHRITYVHDPHNPLHSLSSVTAAINGELTRVRKAEAHCHGELASLREQCANGEKHTKQLEDTLKSQSSDMDHHWNATRGIESEFKQHISMLERQLEMRQQASQTFYKDSNASYEQELRGRENEKTKVEDKGKERHSRGASASTSTSTSTSTSIPAAMTEDRLSTETLGLVVRGLWNAIPSPITQRSPSHPLIVSTSPTLSQPDIETLKQVLQRSKERHSDRFSLSAFTARVKTLVSDNRHFIERILLNAETANLYKSNAEKAHKLALDFKMALEAYKKQVVDLQTSLSHAAKKDGEIRKECQVLREELTQMEKELDAQRKSGEIDSLRLSLAHREDDIQAFKQMQMDKSLGMLDELNSLQTEVADLRQKLRQKGD
ncbi:hypothetical protein E3P94_03652 [Wallemia ichthyophaga]|nr:hypothetical protein E3P95_03655 [Wallemia ichthyophaga]TIA96550.1 hypothetical protein E3P94_03652 [Wallemia ichthyophaga]